MADGNHFFTGLEEARDRVRTGSSSLASGDEVAWALIHEVTALLSSPIDRFDEVLEAVLDATLRLTGADRGFLMLSEDRRRVGDVGQMRVRLARNINFDAMAEQARRISQSIVDDVVQHERGVAIADLGDSTRYGEAASVQDLRLLSVMCVPLMLHMRGEVGVTDQVEQERRQSPPKPGSRVLGVIYVDSQAVRTAFGDRDLVVFQALADLATLAIVHADTFRAATVDGLTGLLSRSRMEVLLREELALACKQGADLSVLLCDIDSLGQINAKRGYATGDEVLRQVAKMLGDRTRSGDAVGRWGGEEFIVVAPGTSEEGALEIARKLLVAYGSDLAFSIGVASHGGDDDSVSALVLRSDQALSKAKEEGGGRARAWRASMGRQLARSDKLAGIFSGDAAVVYRNVLLLLESIPALHHGGSVDRLFERAVERAVDLARAERGFLLLREAQAPPRVCIGRNRMAEAVEPENLRMDLVRRVLASGEPGVVEASGSELAALCAPLTVRGQAIIGALYVDGDGAFADGSAAFLAEFARQTAIAVENARLLEENLAKARKIEKLILALEGEKAATQRALDNAQQLLGASGGVVSAASMGERSRYANIIGESTAIRRVFRFLDRVTESEVPVFIHGESGTGKELVARAIHFNGPRSASPFIAVNCGALTESLLESELFGYVRGAFTGATSDKKGLFEMAHGGTVFLDEVGEMTQGMQTKLLRVLQEGEVRPVGGKKLIHIDVRAISASNKDIKQMVEQREFREDLFYRLNVVRIDLPPLRDRLEDLPLLVEHFLGDKGPVVRIDPQALELLRQHSWPGNVRELANVIERAKVLADDDCITTDAILLDTGVSSLARGAAPNGRSTTAVPFAPSQVRALPPDSPLAEIFFELNERQRRLLEYLQAYGSIRNKDYYEIMGVSKSTGWRDLKDLIGRQVVQVKGRGKGSVYSLVAEYRVRSGSRD